MHEFHPFRILTILTFQNYIAPKGHDIQRFFKNNLRSNARPLQMYNLLIGIHAEFRVDPDNR